MTFLGPEGVNSRIAEIQSRLDSVFPRESSAPTTTNGKNFQGHLNDCGGVGPMNPFNVSGLSGPIGGSPELKTMADHAADRHGVDKDLFSALVDAESSWNPGAQSRVGAKGLCQLMDGTARDMGVEDSYDPAQSLDGGARYLRQMLDKFDGNQAKALAAYNAGPGYVQKHNAAHWPAETKSYVQRILSRTGGV